MTAEEADEGQPIAPETRLFRHIILNAVLDAIYGSCLTNEDSDKIKGEALRWFASAGPDFQTICECAELHPDQVRRRALSYIKAARESLPPKSRRPNLHAVQHRLAA